MDSKTKAFLKLLKMDESGELAIRSYSGRGMHSSECLGIDGSLSSIISNLMALALEHGEDLTRDEKDDIITVLSRGCATDAMGLGSIVYFPGCKVTRRELCDHEDTEEEDCTDDEE